MSNTTTPNTSFADDEDVAFDQSSVSHSAPASGVNNSTLSTEPDFKFVERPKPVGIRDAYCKEIKKLVANGKESIIVAIQIADPDFPVSETNKPIDLWLAMDELSKAESVAKVLGLTLDDLMSEAGRAKGKGVYCRVFVSTWNGKVKVASFAPGFTKRSAGDDAYWKHVDSLGISEAAYKELTKNYCGIIAPR
jgi:hypothetical protein